MKEQDYIRDIAEIRSMMERSSKFLSLSGWAGVMAGLYALAGAYIAYYVMDFNPDELIISTMEVSRLSELILLAFGVLVLAVGTAIYFSYRKARKRGESIWNATSRRLLVNMSVPLVAGGILILIFISYGLMAFVAPLTLLFYGLALYNAGKFTYSEIKALGVKMMILGLLCAYFIEYGLLIWALGFGFAHIVYGIYLYYKYER